MCSFGRLATRRNQGWRAAGCTITEQSSYLESDSTCRYIKFSQHIYIYLLIIMAVQLFLYAEFCPSQPIPSIFFYPGQGSSNLALLTSVYLTSSSQRMFGLHIGLLEMGFQEYIALTILVSCILSM